MRHLSFSIICIVIASIPVSAQPPDTLWTRTFGGISHEWIGNAQLTNDGGLIITGETRLLDSESMDLWLFKTDSRGNEEWSQTFGGNQNDQGNCVQQTSDGGYIIVGRTLSFGAGSNDYWVIKTDSVGSEEWNRTFGGTENEYGKCIQQTNDGGYIISGFTQSFGAGSHDIWLIKTDSIGNEEWNQTFGENYADRGAFVQQTNDGGYVVAGFTNSFGAGEFDTWLVKTDSSGNEEWNQTFGGTENDWCSYVQQTDDGGYIITGMTGTSNSGIEDLWLIKTDSTGTEEWSRTFGGDEYQEGYSVQQTTDGGYIITGFTNSFGAGSADMWLIKTDSIGIEEWSQTFGGTAFDYGKSVQQTNDGGYIVTGVTQSFGAGAADVWVIRLDNEENEIIESTMSSPTDYLLDEVYPNPFNSTTTISVGLPTSSKLKLSVYNITGQEIAILTNKRYSVGYHQLTFNADDLSSGIYFINASVPGKMNEVRKVVLMR
ncbi:MAG: T9SS type A sorting domain-containing protein [Candidatus Electryonea clarkiae]|nr:T9SS type A sorting domain-containing protein [Candidatus Electryonea clarkiae]MDP8286657.1 T9SS type A sorting domain-containing protein [Candidatus Electryonea clarkiae]